MTSAAPTCSHLPQPDPPTFARSPGLLPTKGHLIHGPARPGRSHSQGAGKFTRANGNRAGCCSGSLAAPRLGLYRGSPGSLGRVPFLRRL
jgi:hypothetical protein